MQIAKKQRANDNDSSLSVTDRPSLSDIKMAQDLIKDIDEGKFVTKEFALGDESGYIAVESIPASSTQSASVHPVSTLEDANVTALSDINLPVGEKASPRCI